MAGAVAVVVFDNVDGPLIPMAKKNEDNDVNVPSVFVSKESGEALETLLNDPKHGKTVVVTLESPDSPFDDWPNVATSACVTFGALCVLLSVVLVLKRREQAHLAAMAAQRPPETRLLSAEEVAAVAKTAVFSSQERVLSFLRGATCGGAHASAGDGDGEDDKLVVDNGTGDTCAVCIEDYESGDELRALDCGHAFHKDCIDPWLITKRACCPVCKHVIAPPPPPENVPDSRRRRRSRWSVFLREGQGASREAGGDAPGFRTRSAVAVVEGHRGPTRGAGFRPARGARAAQTAKPSSQRIKKYFSSQKLILTPPAACPPTGRAPLGCRTTAARLTTLSACGIPCDRANGGKRR